jgi:flagellar biosynthetic protein FlhB
MAEEGGQERTEKASGRKLEEARKKGNISKSMDINTAVVLLAAMVIIKNQFSHMGERIAAIAEQCFSELPVGEYTTTTFQNTLVHMGTEFFFIVGPILAVLLATGLIINYLQVGVLFTAEPLKPNLSKLNPIAGFKRMFSRRSVVETFKAIFKMSVVGWIVYQAIAERYPELASAVLMDRMGIAVLFAGTAWEICWRSIFALLVFGVLDWFYQKWEYEKSLRMTKQEVKDEAKQSEGDPMVKGRIRRAQREAARRRMMSEVPKATVVITNPTHFAIALKYDRDTMAVPMVVAKGADLVAQRIKALAAESGVPMIENRTLARELFKKVDIDDEIPEELYATVAEILVMVQKLNSKKKRTAV